VAFVNSNGFIMPVAFLITNYRSNLMLRPGATEELIAQKLYLSMIGAGEVLLSCGS
jgi:hypothetical protein